MTPPIDAEAAWDELVRTRVAGITFENRDGTSRQVHARGVTAGTPLVLRREADNPFDGNAIAVDYLDEAGIGRQLGYVPRALAFLIAPLVDQGVPFAARVVRRAEVFWKERRGKPVVGVRMAIMGDRNALAGWRSGLEPALMVAGLAPLEGPDPGDAPTLGEKVARPSAGR